MLSPTPDICTDKYTTIVNKYCAQKHAYSLTITRVPYTPPVQ